MGTIVRNVLAVFAGLFIGSLVNMGLIMASSHVIAPPAGADVTTMEGLKASMHLFEPRHFLFPFLAHALGALVGGTFASLLGGTHRAKLALTVGACFLIGGIINVFMLPAPVWFAVLDLVVAYLPMGWLAGMLGEKIRPSTPAAPTAA